MEIYSVLDYITISETDILEVCRLKNQFWPHALESQLKWWHNNTSTTDKFIIIRSNQTIVAFLRLRQGYIDSLDYAMKPSICMTEVCVHQQYQQRGLDVDFLILQLHIYHQKGIIMHIFCAQRVKSLFIQNLGFIL